MTVETLLVTPSLNVVMQVSSSHLTHLPPYSIWQHDPNIMRFCTRRTLSKIYRILVEMHNLYKEYRINANMYNSLNDQLWCEYMTEGVDYDNMNIQRHDLWKVTSETAMPLHIAIDAKVKHIYRLIKQDNELCHL